MTKTEVVSFPVNWRPQLALLSDSERGKLLMALFEYSEHGVENTEGLDNATALIFAIYSAQLDEDKANRAKISQTRSECGKMGGRPKKQTKAKKANAFMPQGEDEMLLSAEGVESKEKSKADETALMEKFERFFELYPRKVGKQSAIKAFRKVAPSEELFQEMLAAVEQQTRYTWAGKECEYIPHPSTWLNGKRWMDEVKPLSPRNKARPGSVYDLSNERLI